MLILSTLGRCIAVGAMLATATMASGQELRKVSIGISSTSIASSAPRIAAEMGLYQKHGLDAKIIALESASRATSALLGGSIDFAAVNPTDAVLANARGQNLVAIRSVYAGFPAVMVLSKAVADKIGVSTNASVSERLKALNGLLIATQSVTSSYTVSLKAAVEAEGAAVRFTYMAQPAMVAALQTGAIQGFVASSPFYGMPVLNGSGVVWINGPRGDYPPKYSLSNSITVIAVRRFAEANPDVIKRIDSVFADLGKAVQERPADVKAAIAKLYPEVDAKSLDLILEAELKSFNGKPVTAEDMARAIAFVRLAGTPLPDGIDPAALVLR